MSYSRKLRDNAPSRGNASLNKVISSACSAFILQSAFGNSRSCYIKGRAVLNSIFCNGIRQEWCDEVQRLIKTAEAPTFRGMHFSVRLLLYSGI